MASQPAEKIPPTAPSPAPEPVRFFPWIPLAITLSYALTGKLALLLALPPGYASAIFPPAGIAIATALIYGRRSLPWVFLGSLLLNLWVGYSSQQPATPTGFAAALLIAVASMLQGSLGGWWLRRAVGYPSAFDRASDIARFLMLSPVICLLSASLSVTGLTLLGVLAEPDWIANWTTWWLGDTLGAIVVLPLVLVVAGEPRALWRKREFSVAVPMLLAFALFVFVFIRANQWERDESLMEFRAQSQRTADQMQNHFDSQEFLLEELSLLLSQEGRKSISPEEFRRFVSHTQTRFPGLRGVSWVPRVENAQRLRFEAEQAARIPGYEIRDRNPEGGFKRAAERPFYYPGLYIEPGNAVNQSILGFDIASTPERLETLTRALETRIPIATEPLQLIADTDRKYGLLLILAVDHPASPGVVLTVLRIADFIERTPSYLRSKELLRLSDTESGVTIFDTIGDASRTADYEQVLKFGTRSYRIEFVPSLNYLMQHRGWQSWTVLTVGLFCTGLLGSLLMLSSGYTARVETDVKTHVAELKESTEKLRGLFELSPLGIALTDMQGRYLEFNDAFIRICGYPAEELMTLDYWALTPEKYADDEARRLETLRTHGRYGPFVKEYRRKDGSLVPVSLNGLLLSGRNGEQYIWSIVEDISARRQAEESLKRSEERWKFALEGAGDGVWDWNFATGELFLSRQEMAVLGYEGEDASTTHIDFWVARQHPQDRARCNAALKAYLSGEKPVYACDFRTLCRDGRWKWIRARGILVSRTPSGEPLRMIGTHTDIDVLRLRAAKEAMHSAVMEMLARRGRLEDVLGKINASLEEDDFDLVYAAFVGHRDHLHLLAGDDFPPEMLQRKIRFDAPPQPAGTALFMGHPIATPAPDDIYWSELTALAAEAGLEVCWSEPILSARERVDGTLVAFRRQPGASVWPDLERMQHAANLMRIAIQEKRDNEQLQLAASVYNASSEAIMVIDGENRVVAVNAAFTRITGFAGDEIVRRDMQILYAPEQPASTYQAVWDSVAASGFWRGEIPLRRKNDEIYPAGGTITCVRNDAGQVMTKVCMFSDITERKIAEERISYLASHDALTALPNRTLFADRLQQAIALARRDKELLALLYIDLDDFKPVNDTLGHHIGDQLLEQVARRMQAQVRASDTVARLGGDEFAVLLPAIKDESDARLVAEKIRVALAKEFELDEHRVDISSSIGIAVYPTHGADEKLLSLHADRALYCAKKNGRNIVAIYRPEMDGEARLKRSLAMS